MDYTGVVQTVRQAHTVIKRFGLSGEAWPDDYRAEMQAALRNILQDRMQVAVSEHLEAVVEEGVADRRNGSYPRHLLTVVGDIELSVPRTRTFSAGKVLCAYARREKTIDELVMGCFVLGLSTRKVGKALLGLLGERISPSTVSTVAATLDEAVAAFHRRPLKDEYRVLLLDGVVLGRKTGMGAIRRPVLVAMGIRTDGRKEIIDFRLAQSESEAEWEVFLNDLHRRGLTGENLELVAVDGGKGVLAALLMVYPGAVIQRCWAHKTRNLVDLCRKVDRGDVKKDLHRISHAATRAAARTAGGEFMLKWRMVYPKVVKSLQNDLEDLLQFYRFDNDAWRKMCRTTNAIERRFREVRRRTRPMGVFSDRTSMDRILYAIFTNENQNQETNAPFLLTHKS
jgi:putative transposase